MHYSKLLLPYYLLLLHNLCAEASTGDTVNSPVGNSGSGGIHPQGVLGPGPSSLPSPTNTCFC